jgi:hypothetical protein
MKLIPLDTFKKIACLVVVAIGLSPQPIFGQAKNIRIADNVKGLPAGFHSNYGNIKSAYSESIIYYTSSIAVDKKITIHTFDKATGINDSFRLDTGKKGRNILSERIESFSVSGNKFVFVCNAHIFVFEKQRAKGVRCIAKMENSYSFTKCLRLGEKVLLYTCYNYHPEDVPNKHVWAILNIQTNAIEQIKIQPDDNAIFAAFVNSWIDTYNSKIAYAQTDEYRITILNEKFAPIDSIKTSEFDSNREYTETLREKYYLSKDAIRNLQLVDDSLLTRIRKVYLLNDSTVMALIKLPKQKGIRVDYWRKSQGSWNRICQDSTPTWYVDGETYSGDRITYTDFYQNVYDLPYVSNNEFYLMYYPYIPTITTSNFDKDADYFNLQNEAIQTNNLFFGIKKIQVVIPAP